MFERAAEESERDATTIVGDLHKEELQQTMITLQSAIILKWKKLNKNT